MNPATASLMIALILFEWAALVVVLTMPRRHLRHQPVRKVRGRHRPDVVNGAPAQVRVPLQKDDVMVINRGWWADR